MLNLFLVQSSYEGFLNLNGELSFLKEGVRMLTHISGKCILAFHLL